MPESTRTPAPLFRRPPRPELQFLASALRTETIGGGILLGASLVALVWANTPWHEAYTALRDLKVGPAWGELRLTLGHWAGDGLLAVFFFVAGLEVKREFLVGQLRDPARAAVPVVAAVCGVVAPALVYVLVVSTVSTGDELRGWAIPTATDIAFALAVLAVLGSALPDGLRSFLLTLAVVDDIIAITIIAVFYTADLDVAPLLLAAVPLAAFAALTQRRMTHWWLLVPLALTTWALVHASGVHATVAGVLLGLVVPVRPRTRVARGSTHHGETDLAHLLEHRVRPLSAGLAVPAFAFFASGVRVVGGGLREALADPIVAGIVAGLVVGKVVGVLGGTWMMARFTHARLDDELGWGDLLGLSLLTGIGFTVSLLVGELAFGTGTEEDANARLAVLLGSLLAAALAAVVLRARTRSRLAEQARSGSRTTP